MTLLKLLWLLTFFGIYGGIDWDPVCSPITYTKWSSWSSCSNKCGGGVQHKHRYKCLDKKRDSRSRDCNEFCYNGGSFIGGRCNCPLRRIGRCCEGLRQCTDRNGGCSDICTNVNGHSQCSCKSGFQLRSDQTTCKDIDECQLGKCDQICTNSQGSYSCSCRPGFILQPEGHSCSDIDECVNETLCDHNCTNTPGAYICKCLEGYILDTDGHTCNDVNECLSNNGECSQICINSEGSYHCECYTGYSLLPDTKNCTDINECMALPRNCDHTCTNSIGSFKCGCDEGFALESDNSTCHDINECLTKNGRCSQSCANTLGSFYCTCTTGFRLGFDLASCKDIDECADSISGCSQVCNNAHGAFSCDCLPGYTLHEDKRRCDNIDDCIGSICYNGGTCVDKLFSYTCMCKKGFTGKHCEHDIDECSGILNGGCDDKCINTFGSFHCNCSENTTVGVDGFSCGGVEKNSSIFCRLDLFEEFLPRGCAIFPLFQCPHHTDRQVILSSTASWYQLKGNDSVTFTLGIVFIEQNKLSLPLSLTGIIVFQGSSEFKLIDSSLEYSVIDGIELKDNRTGNCLRYELSPRDIRDFLFQGSFMKTFTEGLSSHIPSWISFTDTGETLYDVYDLQTTVMRGLDISYNVWCRGAPVKAFTLYSVLTFNGDINITLFGQTVSLPQSAKGKQFCFIIDTCHGSSFFIVPEESRRFLEDLDLFKRLQKSNGIIIKPRGIGISQQHAIDVPSPSSPIHVWNGDRLFRYKLFRDSSIWIGGDVEVDLENSKLHLACQAEAEADIFIDLPTLSEIIQDLFMKPWNAYLSMRLRASLDIKFGSFTISLSSLARVKLDTIVSVGGAQEDRKWCGSTANPPGMFLSMVVDINPLRGIPFLEDFIFDINTKVFIFLALQNLHEDISDVLNEIGNIQKELKQLSNETMHFISLITFNDETSGKKKSELLDMANSLSGKPNDPFGMLHSLTQMNKAFNEIKNEIQQDYTNLSDHVQKGIYRIENATNECVKMILTHISNQKDSFSGFGMRFKGTWVIFGIKLLDIEFEMVYSLDRLGACSRFKKMYELFQHKSATRMYGQTSVGIRLGHFLNVGVGVGVGVACADMACIVQLHAEASVLGITAKSDVLVSEKAIEYSVVGNVWDCFEAVIDVYAGRGDNWYELDFSLKGKFVANGGDGDKFDGSYLDGLRNMITKASDEATKRIEKAQEALSIAQMAFTKAQHWLTEKEDKVRDANKEFDNAIRVLEHAKNKVEEAKGPFQRANEKLNNAQRKVDRLCRLKKCHNICMPGIKCKWRYKRGLWGTKLYYLSCHKICLFRIPDPLCVIQNGACILLRGLAYAALEVAKIFVHIPMLVLDAAEGVLTVAQVVVDKSRVILDITVGLMEIAKVALEAGKLLFEGLKYALEAVKVVVKVALQVVNLIIKYGLQSIIDVRNCGFDIELSTTSLPIFKVSCEVNGFRLGWMTVGFTLNFRNILQSLWQAAVSTVKSLMKIFGSHLSGKRKRGIEHDAMLNIHRYIRNTQNETFDFLNYSTNITIDVTTDTIGFRNGSIIDDIENRIDHFAEKCSIFRNAVSFLGNANALLLEVVNETVTVMNNISDIHTELLTFKSGNSIDPNMSIDQLEINQEVAFKDFNITSDNLTSVIEGFKESFDNNTLAKEIDEMVSLSKENNVKSLEMIEDFKVINQWILAMENASQQYYDTETCVSFLDCSHYAFFELYQLFHAENLPNITECINTISKIENQFLNLISNSSYNIWMIQNLTNEINKDIVELQRMSLFCSTAPVFESPLSNQTVTNGSSVQLHCNATANPDPSFMWFTSEKYIIGEKGQLLTLNSSRMQNNTYYWCIAGNVVANRTSAKAYITIKDAGIYEDDDTTEFTAMIAIIISSITTVPFIAGIAVALWRKVKRMKYRKRTDCGSIATRDMVSSRTD